MEEKKVNEVSPLNATLVVIVTFGLSVILGAVLLLTLGLGPALVISELLLLIVPLSYLWVKHIDVKSYIKIDLKPKFVMIGVGFSILLLFINAITVVALTTILGTSQAVQESNTLLINLSQSTGGLVAVVVALSLAGICEEFLFRGFFQNSLNRRFSFIPSIIVSSAAFGLFHFDPQLVYIISTFIAGLVLGYIYHRWQSYVVSATAHSMMNLIVLVLLLFSL